MNNQHISEKTSDIPEGRNKTLPSIKTLIFVRVALIGALITILVAGLFSYSAGNYIRDFFETEGMKVAKTLANTSELAVLYNTEENAEAAVQTALSFPAIEYVSIYNNRGNLLIESGEKPDASQIPKLVPEPEDESITSKILSNTNKLWLISAPIYASRQDPDDLTGEALVDLKRQYLGYVIIGIDSLAIRELQVGAFIKGWLVSTILGLICCVIIVFTLRRWMRPVRSLAKTMINSEEALHEKADTTNHYSRETYIISLAYNRLIERIEEHDFQLRSQNDLLETEVALRTVELTKDKNNALDDSRFKSKFIASVIHELRTPLQSIIGFTEIIQETLDDEGIEDCNDDLEKVMRNSDQMLLLINSILEILKIESGTVAINYETVDINKLLLECKDTTQHLLSLNNNQIVIHSNNLESASIDQQKTKQIIINLLSNASKFSRNSQINLTVSIKNSLLAICVEDQGIGIDQKHHQLIFEPFMQIDNSASPEQNSSGLGLSIVKQLTEILGGSITLESQPRQGSKFTITLPLTTPFEHIHSDA